MKTSSIVKQKQSFKTSSILKRTMIIGLAFIFNLSFQEYD